MTNGSKVSRQMVNNANAQFHNQVRAYAAEPVQAGYDAKTGRPAYRYTGQPAGGGGGSGNSGPKKAPL